MTTPYTYRVEFNATFEDANGETQEMTEPIAHSAMEGLGFVSIRTAEVGGVVTAWGQNPNPSNIGEFEAQLDDDNRIAAY
ncbi:MAG: hypothetical protein WC985_06195 [Thermoplasmata archaeon]